MQSAALSSFWSVWGFILWIVVLSLPILIYLAVAEIQRGRKRRNDPNITLGERLDQPPGHDQPRKRPGWEPRDAIRQRRMRK